MKMLCFRKLVVQKKILNHFKWKALAFYSKRSDSKNADAFKVVKSNNNVNDEYNESTDVSLNWELLTPYGYRYYLPGRVGLAWHDLSDLKGTQNLKFEYSKHKNGFKSDDLNKIAAMDMPSITMECHVQECPKLLRQGVVELFPSLVGGESSLVIVSLHQKKPAVKDVEQFTKYFVCAAQDICTKLKIAGYWADFINPFSGRPYLSPISNSKLYETDQRFRCLGFKVLDRGGCKTIVYENKDGQHFIGSLFTTAPANTRLLQDILEENLQ